MTTKKLNRTFHVKSCNFQLFSTSGGTKQLIRPNKRGKRMPILSSCWLGSTSASTFSRQETIGFLQEGTTCVQFPRGRPNRSWTHCWFAYPWILAKYVTPTPQCAKVSRKSCTFATRKLIHWWWHVLYLSSSHGSLSSSIRFPVQISLIWPSSSWLNKR